MCSSCCCLYLRLLRCHRTCALFPYTTLFRSDRAYRLAARDIAQHPLSARLVTISSCDGAGTATYAGEGLVGLAWAFLHAGAQQVVAALWAVSDSAAPRLMEQMYIGIRADQEPAEIGRAHV